MPDIGEVFDRTVAYQKYRHEHKDENLGYAWCIPDLNPIVGRIQPGWDVRISGEPKIGKTAFMISQAVSVMNEGGCIFYVGLEENDEQLMLRMITNRTGVDRSKFRDLAMADGDWQRVEQARGPFHAFRGRLEYGITRLSDLKKEALKLPDLDVVFIDHMQLMEPDGRVDSLAQSFGLISRGIKLLTLGKRPEKSGDRRQLTTITAVHLNDDGKYLYSRGTARDGDVVLKLHPIQDPAGNQVPNQRLVEVALSRHSASGDVLKIYINGSLSQVAGLYEVTSDVNDKADAMLAQPAHNNSNGKH
jgi:hypothetical protein